MGEVLGALGALEKFGIAGLICAVFAAIIWKLFAMLEKKDKKLDGTIEAFRDDVRKNNESRARDAAQVTKAVEHLTTIVSLINK